METSCTIKKQVLFMQSDDERTSRIRKTIACIPKVVPLPPPPKDLRDMPLPATWSTLEVFHLTPGFVQYIPDLPDTLRTLTIIENHLKEVPNFPNSLTVINLHNNHLQKIPVLPPQLRRLEIFNNFLETIPSPMPKRLEELSAKKNLLTSLPSCKDTVLESVGLSFNNLTTLPEFPNTLERLGCSDNQITVINNLPASLKVLNCSDNPLEVLRIDNLENLEVLIASNCRLKEIPILPELRMAPDNNNQGGGGEGQPVQKGGRPTFVYFFDGNPLTPKFQGIYNRYRNTEISTDNFRKQVLAEHKRILAERKRALGSMIQVFKPAIVSTDAPTTAERVFANHGPGNLLASFITGKPGTIESQRLALLGNQEKLGVVREGTAAAARERLADLAVRGSEVRKEGVPNILQARAKLYVSRGNIAQAKDRFEQELKRIAERTKLKEEQASLVLRLGTIFSGLTEKFNKADYAQFDFALQRHKNKYFMKRRSEIDADLEDLVYKFQVSDPRNALRSIVKQTYTNKDLRKHVNLNLKVKILGQIIKSLRKLQGKVNIRTVSLINETYPQFMNPETYLQETETYLNKMVDRLFPDFRTKENLETAGEKLEDEINLFADAWDNIIFSTSELDNDTNNESVNSNKNNNNNNENNENNNENGNDEEEQELQEAMNNLQAAENQVIQVLNQNAEEEEEALQEAEENGGGQADLDGEGAAIRAQVEAVEANAAQGQRERQEEEDEEELNEANRNAAINRWNYEHQQDGGRKRRNHLTPRKRKSLHQTRRH